jgi:hypothetical protein
MISLLFRFFGDSTPLKKEAEKAKGEMSKAGGEIGKEFAGQLKGAVMGAVGIGALAGALKSKLEEVGKAATAAAATGGEIGPTLAMERASQATGMKQEDILAAAKRSPETFGPFIQQFESGLPETALRNVSRGKAVSGRVWDMIVDAVLNKLVEAGSRFVGAAQFGAGFMMKNMNLQRQGLTTAITGVAPSVMSATPTERFLGAVRSQAESDAIFNEMVDAENRLIEETKRVREAIERS